MVREGDGTTTGYSEGFIMKDGQYLLGDGVAHFIPTPSGPIMVPNDVDGIRPTITNTAGDIVTLPVSGTFDAIVAGFTMDGATTPGHGILVVPSQAA